MVQKIIMESLFKDKVDEAKVEKLINIILPYYNSSNKTKEYRDQITIQIRDMGDINPYEIAYIEKVIRENDIREEMTKREIQQDAMVFEGILVPCKPILTSGHPLDNYLKENEQLLKRIDQIEELTKDKSSYDREKLILIYADLLTILIHFQRLHQVLYAVLAEKGYDRPFLLLWTLDDYIRDELTEAQELLQDNEMDEFISMQPTIIYDVRDLLISKENNNLFPFANALITDDEFRNMTIADQKIGYALIEVDNTFSSNSRLVKFNNGTVNVEELTLIFKNLSLDLTYIDENDKVKFFNDNNSFYKRFGAGIGMDIMDIHKGELRETMLEIKSRLVSREFESVKVVMSLNNRTYLKIFRGVFDKRGNYKGLFDTTQDITDIVGMDITPRVIWPEKN
jgi:DUF438 domain-containing protein